MNWLALGAVGGLLVWTLQTSGPTRRIWQLHPFLGEFGGCDFCMGCWVYALLAWPLAVNVLTPVYVPVVSEVVTGIVFSFVAHLTKIGWKVRWGVEVLE
jgi:hypothetical protein